MKIIKLKAVNIKAIKTAEIKPTGNLVFISGKNGEGKTSLLDCILYALGGKKEIPSKPIREGEDKGWIELDLGELKVIRTFTKKGTYLRVTAKDGAEYGDGQKKLSSLIKSLYFDPLKFAQLSAKEQKEMLLKLIGVNIEKEEQEYKIVYEERTLLGRQGKQVKGEFQGIKKPTEEDLKLKPITISELVNKVGKLTKAASKLSDIEERIEELKAKLAVKEEALKAINDKYPNLIKTVVAEREKLNNAEGINERVRHVVRWQKQNKKLQFLAKEYNDRSKRIEGILKAKDAKLKAAKMPLEGLSVVEEGVIYNDIPFNQLATSEQLKISLALAMATDTELKLIRIMDGSLLDSDNLKAIGEMAEQKDYQIWIEVVDDSGEIGFFIENGEVKK